MSAAAPAGDDHSAERGSQPGEAGLARGQGQRAGDQDGSDQGTGHQDASPEDAIPEDASPEDASPEDASPEDGIPEDGGRRRKRPVWRELPVLILVALVIALLIKSFVVQAFYIPSGSMQDTLAIGDKVLVNKLVYHVRSIEPGDIIVFDGAGSWNAPAAPSPSSDPVVRAYDATLRPLFHSIAGIFGTTPGQTDYIKRVIGVPGDRVACCNARGLITVNGVALHEGSYLYPGNKPGDAPEGESGHFSLTVPAGRLWVLGDHRAISDDSRGHVDDPGNGTIPESAVVGRAFMIVWPPSRWRILPIPSTFGQAGISRPAGSAARGTAAAAAAADAGVPVVAAPSPLPLGGGLAAAIPVTWLHRRLRLRRRRVRPARRARAARRAR
ncbi:MAG: signal peptidase I [Streptosporangiaceae bacterium]